MSNPRLKTYIPQNSAAEQIFEHFGITSPAFDLNGQTVYTHAGYDAAINAAWDAVYAIEDEAEYESEAAWLDNMQDSAYSVVYFSITSGTWY